MGNESRRSIVESLIISSPEPLPARKIADVVTDTTPSVVGQVVADLNNRYMQAGSSFRIRELAGGYQFYIVPEFAGYVQEMFTRRRKLRLTRASLETLAIVAYRQPVTKADIEHIRGVASDGVLHNLLEKSLVTIRGRADTVGKPLQYGTTSEFLKFFGLASLSDLPKMSEIEELIKASQPDGQTELSLAPAEHLGQTAQKLNVADGTYTPRSDEDEQPAADQAVIPEDEVLIVESDPTEDDDVSEAEVVCESEAAVGESPDEISGLPSEPDEGHEAADMVSEVGGQLGEPVTVAVDLPEETETGVVVDLDITSDKQD